MAGPSKRLRRKTTVIQNDLGDMLALTLEYWLRYLVMDKVDYNLNWFWAKYLKMVNKQCSQVLEKRAQVRLRVNYPYKLESDLPLECEAFMVCGPVGHLFWSELRLSHQHKFHVHKQDSKLVQPD